MFKKPSSRRRRRQPREDVPRMTRAISVYHGQFGRATLFHLDRTIIPHAHREGHLLFHVCGTEGHLIVDGVKHAITPDTSVAVNPWAVHEYRPGNSDGQFIVVLYIRPTWFSSHRQNLAGLRFGTPHFSVTPEISFKVGQLAELLAGNAGSDVLDDLLFELTNECYAATQPNLDMFRFRPEAIPNNDYRVRKSMTLMSERLDRELDVARLATDSGLSRPHFFKLFRAQIGVTPKLFWNTLRLERAVDELVATDKPICDISFNLGFSSQSSFSRFFCLNTGMAPTDYRRVSHVMPGNLIAA